MSHSVRALLFTLAGLSLVVVAATAHTLAAGPAQTSTRWTVPASAATETNPLPANAATLAGGKKLYAANCERCHGAAGTGDGPDADAKYAADMDLTNPLRAERNPDSTVFYKIWNGRLNPKMPAFSENMTKEQVWAVVAYAQSLRKTGGS